MTDAATALVPQWQERIRAAAAAGRPLRVRGGGTKDFYGHALEGDVLETVAFSGIVDYDPTELVLTARAGTPLAEVERTMREAGQMLAFEPPHFDGAVAAATLGGCIAAGLAGPRRPYAGAVRDLVLGVRILDGKGDDLRFGGRVMKNVAGFDVARLMTGALGTLGVLLEVSVRCVPVPKQELTRVFECSADEAIHRVNEWGGRPLPLSGTCWHGGRLAVRLSGAAPAVEAAAAKLGGTTLARGDALWASVREQTHPFFATAQAAGAPLWRLAVKSTAPHSDLGGDQLVEWGGALRWLAGGLRHDAARIRAWAQQHGGHATLFRAATAGDAAPGGPGAFHPLPAPVLALHRQLKAVFDPAGILNRHRLYPEF